MTPSPLAFGGRHPNPRNKRAAAVIGEPAFRSGLVAPRACSHSKHRHQFSVFTIWITALNTSVPSAVAVNWSAPNLAFG